MKTKPQPATVHDVDKDDAAILHSKRSATRIAKAASTSPSSRKEKQASSHKMSETNCTFGRSICRGTIEQMIGEYYATNPNTLTIFTRSQDQIEEKNEIPGYRFRKILFNDDTEVVNHDAVLERSRFIRLTAVIPETDQAHPDPRLYVEQRVYERGHAKFLVHELLFGEQIQIGMEYVFPGCGDEDIRLGKRDLRLQIKCVDQGLFQNYVTKKATYYGYNRTEDAVVNKYMLTNGLTYGVTNPENKNMPPCQITFDHHDLQAMLEAKQKKRSLPYTKGNDISPGGLELLKLRFHGLGGLSQDGLSVGYLDLRVVYKP